ncbi:putative ras small GTPase [Paratrimastix pyriformis]|uniref:Ras small GTPase n=1 Tax=Paratrimastix pyriformis TaxID=342808 RepID=A0ABQ8UJA1_9EUKA|nr:putative ras small GTPase [Paratrimastix pyriformis]
MSKRITVFRNGEQNGGRVIMSPPTMPELLHICGTELGIQAKHLFLANGGELTRIDLLAQDDVLYASESAVFKNPRAERPPAAAKAAAAEQQMHTFKIAVIGPGAVGKSALTLRYVRGIFVKDYDPTIEDFYRRVVTVDGKNCCLDILDTAGQDDFIPLRSTWMRGRDGFFFIYAVNDQFSFDEIKQFHQTLVEAYVDGVRPPLVLIGNKADLKDQRQISYEVGLEYARSIGADFVETSAKTGDGIEQSFERLIREMRRRLPVERKPRICTIL